MPTEFSIVDYPAQPIYYLPSGYRTIYHPWEIEFDTAGDDGRTDGWRYITPGTATYRTYPLVTGHLNELAMIAIFGPAPSAATGTVRLFGTFNAGGDWRWQELQLNPTGTDNDQFNLSTGSDDVSVYFSISNNQPASNAGRRLVVPRFAYISVQTSVAQVPVTVMLLGR